jgi:hypothetical protein
MLTALIVFAPSHRPDLPADTEPWPLKIWRFVSSSPL